MEEGKRPTVGAQRRFENLPGMHPTTITLGGEDEGHSVKGTVVDISPGAMCVRLSLSDEDARALEQAEEGDPVRAEVAQSPSRRWIVLGRLAWVWVPSMEAKDTVGSVGIDVAGVIEEDRSWLGRLRGALVPDAPVDVDLEKKRVETPAARRKRQTPSGSSPPRDSGAPRDGAGGEAGSPAGEGSGRERGADDEA